MDLWSNGMLAARSAKSKRSVIFPLRVLFWLTLQKILACNVLLMCICTLCTLACCLFDACASVAYCTLFALCSNF